MAAIALLKFEQTTPSAIVGDGKALVVAPGNPVFIKNSTEGGSSDIASWRIELLYGVPGSPDEKDPGVPGLLNYNAASDTPLHIFTPVVGFYGCYRVKITVWDGAGYTGQASVDIRNIAVATPNYTFILPPYMELPDPLPLPEEDAVDGRENELNFEMPSTIGQPWGWSGDHSATHRLWNEALLTIDGMLTSGGTLDWRDSVLSKGVNDPTGLDVEGNRYLIGDSPVGAWAGHPEELVEYQSGMWVFDPPNPGYATYVEDVKEHYVWNGTDWKLFGYGSGLVGPATGEEWQVCFADSTLMQAYADKVKILSGEDGLSLERVEAATDDLTLAAGSGAGDSVVLRGSGADLVSFYTSGGSTRADFDPGTASTSIRNKTVTNENGHALFIDPGQVNWTSGSWVAGSLLLKAGIQAPGPPNVTPGTVSIIVATDVLPTSEVTALVFGTELAASRASLVDGWVLTAVGTSGRAEWRANPGTGFVAPSGQNYQVAYANGTSLDYAADVHIRGTENGIRIGTSEPAGLILTADSILFGASVTTPDITATDSLTYKVIGADNAHIFEAESTEIVRFDNEGSPRVALPAGGEIWGNFGGTYDAKFVEVYDASSLKIGPQHVEVNVLQLIAGDSVGMVLNEAASLVSLYWSLNFPWTVTNPAINHQQTSAGAATDMQISAQTSTAGDGANLKLQAGGSGAASASGSILLQVAADASATLVTVVEVDYADGLVIHEPGAGPDTISIKHDGSSALFSTSAGNLDSTVPSGMEHHWRVTDFVGHQGTLVARASETDFDIYVPYLSLNSYGTTQGRLRLYTANAPDGDSIDIQASPSMLDTYVVMLPPTNGTSGQVLTTDGNNPAQLTWEDTELGEAGAGILQTFPPILSSTPVGVNNKELRGSLIIPAGDVVITQAHISVQQTGGSGTRTCEVAVYNSSGVRQGGVASFDLSTVGFKTSSFSGGNPPLTSGVRYYLMMTCSDDAVTSAIQFINVNPAPTAVNEEPYGGARGDVTTGGVAPGTISGGIESSVSAIPWIAVAV